MRPSVTQPVLLVPVGVRPKHRLREPQVRILLLQIRDRLRQLVSRKRQDRLTRLLLGQPRQFAVVFVLVLERKDVDRDGRVLRVERTFIDGAVKFTGKTPGSVPRTVPLRQRVLDAIEQLPPRLDSVLLFPTRRGAHLDLDVWRLNHWAPAIRAAGLDPKLTPYSMRHWFISEAIRNPALSMFEIAQVAGTSVAMIEATYGHKMPDLGERWRIALDASDQTFGHLSDSGD